ncbi:hypothetical protein [Nocardia mexicana]|uniref:Phosphotransferase family enzyme n=1 Tax=Nocardia mexicana TaxID=279262 RepID=A0A370GI55_9NOCA|nr:hypothetical protein [Nocardia mexicana]RDI43475.1 hypothetical protein DFR68_12132 [Nocardia mexicana]
MTESPIAEYGTDLLRTSIGAHGSGFLWRRRPGPLAPSPFVTGDYPFTHVAHVDDVRLVPGRDDGPARVYEVRGQRSVARVLLREGPRADLTVPLRGMGALLRALHEQRAPALAEPRGIVRLRDWLSGCAGTQRASDAYRFALDGLGSARTAVLADLCVRISSDDHPVLSHGAPSLGSLAVGDDPRAADLLVGEDLCAAPWYFDVGWVVGELVELQCVRGVDASGWEALIQAFLDGYGRDLGSEWSLLASMRIMLHLHDYTAYVAWRPEEFTRYLHLLAFLIDSCPGS